jgi:D-threo-aldose 1-dehydrogenase
VRLFGASRVGLGGAPLGNLFSEVPEADAAATVEAAWDAGWRYFDNAPHYGLGLSERRMGEVLRAKPRDEFVLSTKVGRLLVDGGSPAPDDEGFAVTTNLRRQWDFSADGIRRSIDESLERLGLDRVDVVFLHDPDDHYRPAMETGFPALAKLRDEGVIGAIGAGMNQSEMLASFVRETDLDVIMLAGRYTVLDHAALDDVLPACVEHDVAVIAVGVFNSGLLSRSRPLPGATFDYAPAPGARVETANAIADVCAAHGVTLPAVALQFPLAHPAVAGVAVGCRTADEVRRNAALAAEPVPAAVWSDLKSAGLVRTDAPSDSGH